MEVSLNVKRFDPESNAQGPHFQEYNLDVEEYFTVLDALIKVREEMDGSLALRCSCRASICGSCSMRVNGHAKLVCKTKVRDVVNHDHRVTVEPMNNLPVVKDLVTDMEPFWDKVRAIQPWLQPYGTVPEKEYIAPNETMLHLAGVMSCIMCGACVSDCTALEVDKNFIGPAALAKAYRFVGDPRDDAGIDRLRMYGQSGGIWDCTRCMECVQVCPKGVAPMERIMGLRDKAIEAGLSNNNGARHTEAFGELVKHSGRLDELRLPIKTFGIFNFPALIGLLPVGLRALRKGKMPPIIHKAIPGVERVRRIFEKVESKK
ncbi:MAG: succinate dehydrogenase iron-sulfur subunit [Dehalococcoidia bacterium]|jgi:succinate dehydrogenase / fumarate reductase iron-sulfur subunit|nr:succinate dehydrogenase iron-sulfur subunit [Dehalococcoidia bacterium]